MKEWGLIAKFSQWVVVWLTVWTEFHNPSAPSEPTDIPGLGFPSDPLQPALLPPPTFHLPPSPLQPIKHRVS